MSDLQDKANATYKNTESQDLKKMKAQVNKFSSIG
jgi:hypothetical protein